LGLLIQIPFDGVLYPIRTIFQVDFATILHMATVDTIVSEDT